MKFDRNQGFLLVYRTQKREQNTLFIYLQASASVILAYSEMKLSRASVSLPTSVAFVASVSSALQIKNLCILHCKIFAQDNGLVVG